MLGAILNARRRYNLTGVIWQGKHNLGERRITLERYDGSRDSGFFLYFHDGGFIGRVYDRTVAANTKWVIFKKGKEQVRVLREDLLTALGALA